MRRAIQCSLSLAITTMLGAGCGSPSIGSLEGSVHVPGPPLVIDVGGNDQLAALATLPDGRILGAGRTSVGNVNRFLLARFTADAALDQSFGNGGFAITDLLAGDSDTAASATSLAIQPGDGKIVVAGGARPVHINNQRMGAARYLPDGTLDATFGQGGYVTLDAHLDAPRPGDTSSDGCNAVALQKDGKIILGGSAAVSHDLGGPQSYWSDIILVRLRADGAVDPTFGDAGFVRFNFGLSSFIYALAVLDDDRIVAAGSAAPTGQYDLLIARFTPDGQFDGSFGDGGRTLVDLGGADQSYALHVMKDGGYLIGGEHVVNDVSSYALASFTSGGALDRRFGDGGTIITPFPRGGAGVRGLAIIDAHPWAAGFAVGAENNRDFAIARYLPNGRLEPCHQGDRALATLPITPGATDVSLAMALQPDGTPVLAGNSNFNLAIVRLPRNACAGSDH